MATTLAHPPGWTYPVVVGTGIALAVSSRANGAFAVAVNSPFEAAWVNFAIGLILLTVIIVFMKQARAGLRSLPGFLKSKALPWWALFGGVCGAFYVTMQSVAVPLLGVAVFTVAVVAGQTSSSLLVDRFGIGPAGRQIITVYRIVGAALTVVAVTIAVSNRFGGASLSIAAILAALGGGIALSGQQAFNGRVGAITRQPIAAAWLSFLLGFLSLTVLVLALDLSHHMELAPLPSGPWWIYLSPFMGVIYIVASSWIVPKVGVLIFGLLTVLGQLAGALLFDIFAPLPGSDVSINLVSGLVLAFIAVFIATRRKKVIAS